MKVYYIYTYEDGAMKPTKHCEKGEKGNIIEGVNFFKVHYVHVWNHHNEIP
jgi:hypothetical protein